MAFTGRMAVGGSATATVSPANKIGLMISEGAAGQRISLKTSNTTITNSWVYIYNPNGTTLVGPVTVGSGSFVDTLTLAYTGTYTILIDPLSSYSGNMTLTLYDVPPDPTAGISPGGASVTLTTTSPGQNMHLTFSANAGQRVSLKMDSVTVTSSNVYMYKPDGTQQAVYVGMNTSGAFIDTQTLAVTGTYSILVDPSGDRIGSVTSTLMMCRPRHRQYHPRRRGGNSGDRRPRTECAIELQWECRQMVSLNITGVTVNTSHVSILKPDGAMLIDTVTVTTSVKFIDTMTLPVAGVYTIVVNPAGWYTGSLTLTLYDVIDFAGTIRPGVRPPRQRPRCRDRMLD